MLASNALTVMSMSKRTPLHVIFWCCIVTGISSATTPTSNQTSSEINFKNEVPYFAASVLNNCTLIPENSETISRIRTLLADGTKLIKYNLQIARQDERFINKASSGLYKPFNWVRSAGRHGTGLLLLQPRYDIMSLTTLELGVVTEDVRLKEFPSYCMDALNFTEIELIIQELIMNDFQNETSGNVLELQPSDSVCNIHVLDNGGKADFRYKCCQRSDSGNITCKYLEEDIWLKVLLGIIFFIKVMVVLFSPRFIPDSFYRLKHVAAPYVHKFTNDKRVSLTIVKTKEPGNFSNVKNVIKLSKFKTMPKFKITIQNMSTDVPSVITLKEVCLRIKRERLLADGSAPVGLVQMIYESFIKCKIRERPSLTDCCNADIFSSVCCCRKELPWYRLLKTSMKLVVLFLLAMPWLIRVYIYFMFEHDEWNMRKSIAKENNLSFDYPGNMTLYVTPLHVIFIFVYVLLALESCIFGVIPSRTKETCKFVLRKCFRDMREMKQTDVIGWVIRVVLKPCTGFGGLGICIALIIWLPALPIAVLVLSFYLFPTLNVTMRLVAHFALYTMPRNACSSNGVFASCSAMLDKLEKQLHMENIASAETLEKDEKVLKSASNRLFVLTIIFFCILSLYSVIFLVTEFASFIVEVLVYTLMGLIVNASSTLTYISLFLLLGIYGNDVFGKVAKTYEEFSKTMHGIVMGLAKKKVEQVIYNDANGDMNCAFKVKTERAELDEQPATLIKNSEGFPRWRLDQLVLFLSNNNKPLIPKTFYYKSSRMPYYAVPGELLMNYLNATKEFGAIVVFLAFVLIVVLAFGDTYHISTSNKLLATIAGGFLPLMLRKLVFKSQAVAKIDTDNIYFQACLNNLLDNYIQSWPVFDIDVRNEDMHALDKKDVISGQPQSEANKDDNGNGNGHGQHIDIKTIEESEPFIKKEIKSVDDQSIDILIDIRQINYDDFPGMQPEDSVNVGKDGSISLLNV